MTELPDFFDEYYDPRTVMARVGHLPERAQNDIEQISRILRAAFGYGQTEMPADGRVVSIALTGPRVGASIMPPHQAAHRADIRRFRHRHSRAVGRNPRRAGKQRPRHDKRTNIGRAQAMGTGGA